MNRRNSVIAIIISIWFVVNMIVYDKSSSMIVGFRIDRLLFFIIVTIFAVNAFQKKTESIRIERAEIYMILFTVACTISLFVSGSMSDPNRVKNYWFSVLSNITFYPFITYFVAKSIRYNAFTSRVLTLTLCFVGLYLSLTGIFEHYRVYTLVWPSRITDPSIGIHWGRSRGPFLDSVAMGRTLVISCLCALVMSTEFVGGKRILLLLLAGLITCSIYFTETRGPWVGFGIALIVVAIRSKELRGPIAGFVVLLLALTILGIGTKFSLTRGSLFFQRQETIDYRFITWIVSLKMVSKHPAFGIGFGKFNSSWESYLAQTTGVNLTWFDGSHNTFFTILAEVGVVGLFLYLAILFNLFRTCVRSYQMIARRESFEGKFIVIVIASALMYFITGFFSDLKWTMLVNNIVFAFFGVAKNLASSAKRSALPASTVNANE